MGSKGPNFNAAEDLALAKAWVSASENTTNKKAEDFWIDVLKRFEIQNVTNHMRTSGSLETRWRTLNRTTQKYLAADKLYRSSKVQSGECEEDIKRNIMTLYCETNKYKDKGVLPKPGPIKFMDAIFYLGKVPKFSMKIGGGSSTAAGYRPFHNVKKDMDDIEEESNHVGGNIGFANPSLDRPRGIKKKKQEGRMEHSSHQVARSVDKMASVLATAASDKRKAASLSLQLEIVKSTPMCASEKRKILELLRRDAEQMFQAEESGDTGPVGSISAIEKGVPVLDTVHVDASRSINLVSSSLHSAPSFLVTGPNSSSFQQFP